MDTQRKTITRKKDTEEIPAELKYKILKDYSEGVPVSTIAQEANRDSAVISTFISKTLQRMNVIRDTNDLKGNIKYAKNLTVSNASCKFITQPFLDLVEEKAEVYAYYYGQTGDNKFSLDQSGLSIGIIPKLPRTTKDYVYRIRGQYLRDIPQIKKYIRSIQDEKIREYRLEKPQVQMEIVQQIEELKEIAGDDPRARANLLKAIEMLGRTIGAFTDRLETEDVTAKSGLQILMERAKEEISGSPIYEISSVN